MVTTADFFGAAGSQRAESSTRMDGDFPSPVISSEVLHCQAGDPLPGQRRIRFPPAIGPSGPAHVFNYTACNAKKQVGPPHDRTFFFASTLVAVQQCQRQPQKNPGRWHSPTRSAFAKIL